jgi:hypothetical protein
MGYPHRSAINIIINNLKSLTGAGSDNVPGYSRALVGLRSRRQLLRG